MLHCQKSISKPCTAAVKTDYTHLAVMHVPYIHLSDWIDILGFVYLYVSDTLLVMFSLSKNKYIYFFFAGSSQ